jgi:hypothetical protein
MLARALGLVSHAMQLYFTCVAVFILAVWQLLAAAAAAVDVRLDRLLRKAAGSTNYKVLRVAARFFWRCYRRLLLLFPSPPPTPASRVAARPELWKLIAEHSGVVGAWRLKSACKAAKEGAEEWLRTLPGLVVCGGYAGGGEHTKSDVWRLDLGQLRWDRLPSLTPGRSRHACCAVRGKVVVLGGDDMEADEEWVPHDTTGQVLRYDAGKGYGFTAFPPLLDTALPWEQDDTGEWEQQCVGSRAGSIALAVDESESAEGQLLLVGGDTDFGQVLKVNLATGTCTAQPEPLWQRWASVAARLPDGRIVCAGGSPHRDDDDHTEYPADITAEVMEPPADGSGDPAWRWRELPHMSVGRFAAACCILSDGRFAIFGGVDYDSSCEALTFDGGERWEPLPPMRYARRGHIVCAAVGGCVIVAGGSHQNASWIPVVEVYEEGLRKWRQLPCNLSHSRGRSGVGSALLPPSPPAAHALGG